MAVQTKNEKSIVRTGLAAPAFVGALASLLLLGTAFTWMWYAKIVECNLARWRQGKVT